jgi:hypothetical protein
VITSYKEEGLHYHLFTGQFVITSYKEEGLHYHLFTGQFVINELPRKELVVKPFFFI